jgi:hypothetical protein
MTLVGKMRRVEWSWVKAHNGRLLTERADTLATKGVKNAPRNCPIECVRVRDEDMDLTTYVLKDGEETPLLSEDDSVYPAGKMFMMKDGDQRLQYLSESEPASDEPKFDEITKLPVPQWPSSPDPSELEESDTHPQPPESEDDGGCGG